MQFTISFANKRRENLGKSSQPNPNNDSLHILWSSRIRLSTEIPNEII